ncbi:MAG TPA: 3-hydroxyacyl-CoA dehydrogenase NAD-binding domain-containing protein [Planctomycetota bacterium]|nr:3-hydroxyacyl-CoA dehydrogenase NAD-binding domain-containing protein [Planctomycetota bacterium]
MGDGTASFGVVGAGIMGRGIAEVAVGSGGFDRVVLHDSDRAQLDAAAAALGAAAQGLTVAADPGALAGCRFVVEAVTERIEAKSAVFALLGGVLAPDAVLVSNTSSIPITRLAAGYPHPGQVAGLHFMNPAPRMRGVEVIRGLRTSAETLRTTLATAARLGKEAVACRDRSGFVVNRILYPMLNAAAAAAGEGRVDPVALDRAASIHPAGPRLPMGPLMLADLIGLDTVRGAMGILRAELGPGFEPAAILDGLVGRGALGAKSGAGFLLWSGGRPRGANPLAAELRSGAPAGASPEDPAEAARRAWLAMANEALRVVEEGTSSAADVDRACLHCLNHRVGILAALDGHGLARALAELGGLEARFGPAFQPPALLRRLTEAGFGGRDGGAGIYLWDRDGGAPAGINPSLEEYLGVAPDGG